MVEKIADDFYFIQRGWLSGNHFVFNGERKILIDTGYKKDVDTTLRLIKQTGLDPADVDLIITTHSRVGVRQCVSSKP